MQVKICTPVASGIRFSFQELWTIWTLMFYKTPMAVAALCVICIACPTNAQQSSHNALHQHA